MSAARATFAAGRLARSNIRSPVARRVLRGDEQFPGDTVPFNNTNKVKTFVYVFGFLGFGFAAPFIVAKWTLNKNGLHSGIF